MFWNTFNFNTFAPLSPAADSLPAVKETEEEPERGSERSPRY